MDFPRYSISVSNVALFYGMFTSNSDQIVCLTLALPVSPSTPLVLVRGGQHHGNREKEAGIFC